MHPTSIHSFPDAPLEWWWWLWRGWGGGCWGSYATIKVISDKNCQNMGQALPCRELFSSQIFLITAMPSQDGPVKRMFVLATQHVNKKNLNQGVCISRANKSKPHASVSVIAIQICIITFCHCACSRRIMI